MSQSMMARQNQPDGGAAPIIKVDGLAKTFGQVKAVDNINFEVKEGEIFGFLGPNGAGKSTTINMLTTMMKPTSGKAVVCGFNVTGQATDVRRRVGVVPQEFTADEDMTGYENILLCADLYGMPKSDAKPHAEELLKLVELQDAANRKVKTYSGGMRRRLEIACGLINYPHLLFLDEPTLGLDVQTRAAVWKYIRVLKEGFGMTLFLTTHYLEEADSLCDRIAIIDHGHIIRIGTPAELKAAIGGDILLVGLKENEPDLSAEIAQVSTVREVKKNGTEYRIKASNGEEVSPQVMNLVMSKGLHLTKISLTKPTLDQAYLELTGKSIREEESNRWQAMSQRITMSKARS
jgi:ABC-2 type transport system ATP-binding protein